MNEWMLQLQEIMKFEEESYRRLALI
jgi:hypothetical protein